MTPVFPPGRRPRRRLLLAAAGMLVLTCIALAIILATGRDNGTGASSQPAPGTVSTATASADSSPSQTAVTAAAPLPDAATEPAWYTKQKAAEARQKAFEATLPPSPSTSATTSAAALPAASGVTTSASAAARTAQVGSNGSTPLRGVWSGTAQRLADYLLAESPQPGFSVPVLTLAALYVRYAAEVGLRADLLWAQMLHETGFGRYGGDVLPAQNNYAGIGATGGGEPGISFPTAEDGVKAQIAHMAAYVFTEDVASWTNDSVDPRYAAVRERGVVRVLSDLDGRWAVPGVGYGAAIERHVAAINR